MLSSPCQPAVNSAAASLLCFREMQLCRVDLSQSTTSHHLKGATKVNASLLLWDHLIKAEKNSHWHLIVKTEYIKIRGHPRPGQIKAYLLELDRLHTKSVGSCSLVEFRGLSRQRSMQDQQAFCSAELAQSVVEVNNPRDTDRHLLSVRYYTNKSFYVKMHAQMQVNAYYIKTLYSTVISALIQWIMSLVDMQFVYHDFHNMPTHSRDESFCVLVNIGHLYPGLMSHDDRHTVQQPPMQQRLEAFERQWLYLSYSWFCFFLRSAWLCDLQPLIWTTAGSKDTIQ